MSQHKISDSQSAIKVVTWLHGNEEQVVCGRYYQPKPRILTYAFHAALYLLKNVFTANSDPWGQIYYGPKGNSCN